MLETPLRHAATVLLESAIRLAPPDTREWGQAMLGELRHVEGRWAAVMWALGGAGVMAKHALVSLLIPGRRQGLPPGDELFAKNVSLRKAALVAAAGFILAALLFFAAPPFRQGIRVSFTGWHAVFRVTEPDGQLELHTLSKRAEAQHDPEGLVFAAARLSDANESARLAEEAIQLDPNFIWAYAVVAVRHPELAEIRQWVPRLECRDPKNALSHLISAESIDIDHANRASKLPPKDFQDQLENDSAWQRAMAAAYASPTLDDYLLRLRELDTRVARRYGFNDPDELLSGEEWGLPSFASSDSQRFAKSILQFGQDLEVKGDPRGAVEKYWSVARFGQTIESQGRTDAEYNLGLSLQIGAYKRLQKLSEKGGNANEAALFAYLAGRFEESMRPVCSGGTRIRPGAAGQGVSGRNAAAGGRASLGEQWVFGEYVARRNAAVLQVSSLMMVIFTGLTVVALAMLIAGRRRGGRADAPRSTPVATIVALTSTMGLLLSSATIYLTYRPYWYILQRAMLNGDRSQTRDLSDFLMATRGLPGVGPGSYLTPNLPMYFWTGVTLLGSVGLVLILLRHFLSRPRANKLQHHPRVP